MRRFVQQKKEPPKFFSWLSEPRVLLFELILLRLLRSIELTALTAEHRGHQTALPEVAERFLLVEIGGVGRACVDYFSEVIRCAGDEVVVAAENFRAREVAVAPHLRRLIAVEVRSSLPAKVGSFLSVEVGSLLSVEVRSSLPAKVGSFLSVEVGSLLSVEVGSRLSAEVGSFLSAEVRSRLPVEVGSFLPVEVRSRLSVEVGSFLSAEVRSLLSVKVGCLLSVKVWSFLSAEVRSLLPVETRSFLSVEVRSLLLTVHSVKILCVCIRSIKISVHQRIAPKNFLQFLKAALFFMSAVIKVLF